MPIKHSKGFVVKKINSTWLAALVVSATMSTAFSATPNKFSSADTNRDRALSRVEACAGKTRSVCKNFNRIDVNRDGVVTRAEIRSFNNGKRAARGLPPKP
ncbi:MAG: hypothetical protein EAZ30_16240 [Betaproteobacteria bacterium]|nr:MAG: hypothetical protein EAZ30_16240 [Betaproteobacteria bacterium]